MTFIVFRRYSWGFITLAIIGSLHHLLMPVE